MAAIQIKTASKVVPQCYAYTTPGVPAHDGWTKIGFTERDVETRINEQTHTVGVAHKTWWALRAAFMTEPYGTFTDKDFHAYLKKLGISREAGTEWFLIEPNTARGNFIDFTQNHGVVSEDDADAVIPYKLRDEQAEAVQQDIPEQSLSISTDPKVLKRVEKKYVAEILKSGESEIPKRVNQNGEPLGHL